MDDFGVDAAKIWNLQDFDKKIENNLWFSLARLESWSGCQVNSESCFATRAIVAHVTGVSAEPTGRMGQDIRTWRSWSGLIVQFFFSFLSRRGFSKLAVLGIFFGVKFDATVVFKLA